MLPTTPQEITDLLREIDQAPGLRGVEWALSLIAEFAGMPGDHEKVIRALTDWLQAKLIRRVL